MLQNIDHDLQYAGTEFGKLVAMEQIINEGEYHTPVLIFVQSKHRAIDLEKEMAKLPVKAKCIHSAMNSQEREAIIEQFRQQKIWSLICTDLLARGSDFKGINLVINYDFPTSVT